MSYQYHHHHYNSNINSKIARPSSITLPVSTIQPTQTITNNSKKKKQTKQPNSHLSKSHSMHRLLLQDEDIEEPIHRRALLSRATTTPMPRPSSLIKRFSDHTAMKRCTSLMNPPLKQSISNTTDNDGGDLVYNNNKKEQHDFRLGQRVCVPSHNVVGTVKYFGETKFKEKGVWVGIELDLLGTGKNDGSIQGVRYFSCAPNTGLFILATKVIGLEDSHKKKIIPRISKTTAVATTKKSQSASTKRKSMIITSSTTTTSSNSTSTTTATSKLTSTPKRNRSATTTNAPLNPSKSARTLSTHSSNAPLPTRSTPSGATTKTSTSTKTSKPALKKSSSMNTSSADCHHHHHHRSQQDQSQQTRTQTQTQKQTQPQPQKRYSTDLELERVNALLEKSRQEKRALSQQMDGQEAAWERLVSAKESYAVRVQEKDDEIAKLKRLLENSSQATHELTKMSSERDSALSRASMSEAMEKQHSKVIERLDLRVRTMQQQQETLQQNHEATQRDHAAQMDQVRKQLTERDEAAAIVERECSELCQDHVKTIKSVEASMKQREEEYAATLLNKDSHIAKLQHMVNDLMYPSTASPIIEDDTTRHRLEVQLELTTCELDKERELIKAQALDIDQLKDEIKRLHRVSVCSSSGFYQLRSELEHEIEDKRRIMEEANSALEIQARLEEENERIKLTNEKTQRDLADVLRKLATTEKERGSANLIAKNSQLEADNEKLYLQQKQTEHECMRLMDELLAIERVESTSVEDVNDDKMYRREIEQLKLQVNREVRKYEDLEQNKETKIHKLYKELSDLESLVENKVFSETELEEAIKCEKRKVRMLEDRLREVEEENNRRLPMHAPLSPISPQYSLFHRQHHQQKRSSTGSFSLMTSISMDTVSDHGNLLESVYCEICEEYGHEVMTCNAYKQKPITDEKEEEEEDDDSYGRSSYYCVNCDVFDTHPTEDCPNQDETF